MWTAVPSRATGNTASRFGAIDNRNYHHRRLRTGVTDVLRPEYDMSTQTTPEAPSALALAALHEVQRHISAAADPASGALPYGDEDARGYWYRAWYLRARPGAHDSPVIEVVHTESLHPLRTDALARLSHVASMMEEHDATAIVVAHPPYTRGSRVHSAIVEMAFTAGSKPITSLGTLQGVRRAPGAAITPVWRWSPARRAAQMVPTIAQPMAAAATVRRRRRRVESASIRPMPPAVAQPSAAPAPVPPPHGGGGTDSPGAGSLPARSGAGDLVVGGGR